MFVADADPLAPARVAAACHEVVPSGADRSFRDALLTVIEVQAIDVVVPLSDADLAVLADLETAGGALAARSCQAIVSTPSFVELASDKLATVAFCREHDIRTPTTWLPGELEGAELPDVLFVRPRRGSGSGGAAAVPRAQVPALVAAVPDCLVQAHVRRAEVTIDALFDRRGELLHLVPRLRVRVDGGRATRAVTIDRPSLDAWARRVLDLLGRNGARGPVNVQAFLGPGEPQLIEVNARLAAGVPLTIAAGGDHPAWILDLATGRRPSATLGAYRRGVTMSTYPEPVIDG